MTAYYVNHEETQKLERARDKAVKLQYQLDLLWDEYYGLVDLGIKNRTPEQQRRVNYILRRIDKLEKEIFNTYPGSVSSGYIYKNSRYRNKSNKFDKFLEFINKSADFILYSSLVIIAGVIILAIIFA